MNPETHAAVEIIKTAVILLKRHVDWERALKTLSRLESEISQPSFWDNQENAQKVMREKTHLDSQVTAIRHLEETLTDQIDMVSLATEEGDEEMVAEAEAAIGELAVLAGKKQLESLLSGEADANNCFLEIHPGAGGTEAQDWAAMLLRMYARWADARGFKTETIEESSGEEAGIKSATLRVMGTNAYGC